MNAEAAAPSLSASADVQSLQRFLGSAFGNDAVVQCFLKAYDMLRGVDEQLRDELLATGTRAKRFVFPHLELEPLRYWERNFFSILFVSIFQSIGIADVRTREYTGIVHSMRSIVTSTDNILDDEAKGAFRVDLPNGIVMPNVLAMLFQCGVLGTRLDRVARSADVRAQAWGALLDLLYAIGEEEAGEEGAVEQVLPPLRLLDEIHRYRGANLLLLAFVVPRINEPEHVEAIAQAQAGIFRLGLSLQVLDDLADFQEDLRRRNHNVLRSWLVHGAGSSAPVADEALAALDDAALATPHLHFPQAVDEVMALAVELALSGFDRIRAAGHPLDRPTASRLMGAMFALRGLPHLWTRHQNAAPVAPAVLAPYLDLP